MRLLKKLLLASFVAALVLVVQAAPAKAYSNENMIDNAVFDAKDAMNESQIRSFIQSRPNTCLTRVGSGLGGGNIFDEPMDYFNYGPSKVDAARVIYKAAQYNEINPRVILATLQKEQGMLTDSDCISDSPSLNKAMGYACYESASECPASWAAGFERQVMKGAWQLAFDRQRAEGNMSWGGNDSITYGGRMTEGSRKRCGTCSLIYYDGYSVIDGVNTKVLNGATASLYNYTPHRGQSFPYWFEYFFGVGSTRATPYSWEYVSQSSNKSLSQVYAGEVFTVTVMARNSGSQTWYNTGQNQLNIATYNPAGRISQFADNTWLSPNTAARMTESSVAPGETATFSFSMKAPAQQGSSREYLNLVAQNITWLNDPGQYFEITVLPTYKWASSSQAAYTDSTKTTQASLSNMSPGQTGWLVVRATNSGNTTWTNTGQNRISLVTDRSFGRSSRFANGSWLTPNTPANLSESSVAPGQTGTFEFPITIPAGGGTFSEYFNPIVQNYAQMNNDVGQYFQITVKQDYKWAFSSQAAYTDSGKGTPLSLANLPPGQTAWLVVRATNTGQSTWVKTGANQLNLATDRSFGRNSRFANGSWLSSNTPARMNETSVPTGQIATFEFPIEVPPGSGTFKEYFNPIVQNIALLNSDVGQYFSIGVASIYKWASSSQAAYTDSTKTTQASLSNMSPGQTGWLVVRATNSGNTTWTNTGQNRISLVTDRSFGRSSRFANGSWLTPNTPANLSESSVAPGQTGTFEFPITIPAGGGTFSEYFNPIVQNYAQMNNDVGQYFQITVN